MSGMTQSIESYLKPSVEEVKKMELRVRKKPMQWLHVLLHHRERPFSRKEQWDILSNLGFDAFQTAELLLWLDSKDLFSGGF